MNGPSRFGRIFLVASSAVVSERGWTLTYPAALTKMLGDTLSALDCDEILSKTEATEDSDVMSHSKAVMFLGVVLPKVDSRTWSRREDSKGA